MTTPKAIAEGRSGTFSYTYYADSERDLSSSVTAGGWLKAIIDPTEAFVAFAYDRAGNRVRSWDRDATAGTLLTAYPGTVASPPSSEYTEDLYGLGSNAYDAPWRYLRSHRDQLGNKTTYSVDENGNVVTIRPPRGNEDGSAMFDTVQAFDENDNLRSVKQPEETSAEKWLYGYDAFDNQVSTIDPNGHASTVTFDSVNRPTTWSFTRRTWALADSTAFPACRQSTTADTPIPSNRLLCTRTATYDGVDNVVARQGASHQTTTFDYDGGHREIRRDVPRNDGSLTTLRTDTNYDADGNVTDICPPRQFTEGGGSCSTTAKYSTHQTWDVAGRLATRTTYRSTAPLTTTYAYDADGNQTTVTDANGHVTTSSFDLLGRKVAETRPRSATKSNTTSWIYSPAGDVTAVVRPGGIDTGTGANGPLVVDGTGPSTDGIAHPASNPYVISSDKHYTDVTLRNGGTITTSGAAITINATGTIRVCATCAIRADGGGSGPAASTGGTGGGGAINGGGGGGGGHGTAGEAGSTSTVPGGASGSGGAAYGTGFEPGAAGGTGGSAANGLYAGGSGGVGGRAVHLTASRIDLIGTVTAHGSAGAPGAAAPADIMRAGSGGGGAGGSVWLTADSITAGTSSISTVGGAGGSSPNGNRGGNGGNGTVRIDAGAYSGPSSGPGWASATRTSGGLVTAYSYDAAHRPLDVVAGADNLVAAAAGLPSSDGGTNTRTRNVYDADGHVIGRYEPRAFRTSTIEPDPRFLTRVDYDADGRAVATWRPRYDTDGHSDIGSSLGSTAQTTNCPTGQAGSAAGLPDYPSTTGVCVTRAEYDAAGNTVQVTLPTAPGSGSNRYVAYTYTDDNLVASVDAPSPETEGSRVTNAAVVTYDADGRRTQVSDALGHARTWTYRADGVLWKTQGEPGTKTHLVAYAYDADGNRTTVTDAEGDVTATSYTTDGLVAAVVQGAGTLDLTTSYTYDNVGNPIQVKSPAANAGAAPIPSGTPTVNTFTWDNLLDTATIPVAGDATASVRRRTTYGYDQAGRRITTRVHEVNASGTAIAGRDGGTETLSWHPNDRLASRTGTSAQAISHTYDAAGHPTAITDSSSSLTVAATWYLDDLVRTVDQGDGHTSLAAYDGGGRQTLRADQTSSGTSSTLYTYGDAGLPTSMTSDLTGANAFTWTYDPVGRQKVETFPGGAKATSTYNADDTLATRVFEQGGSSPIFTWTYTWDGEYRQLTQGFSGNTVDPTFTYRYDDAGRVDRFTIGTTNHLVTYDKNSNRTSYRGTTWAHNADDSLASDSRRPSTAFGYSPRGSLAEDGCTTYTYDGFNRLAGATPHTGTSCPTPKAATTFGYDGLDRQRSSTASATMTSIGYDAFDAATIRTATATTSEQYVLDPMDRANSLSTTSGVQHLISDGVGNVSRIITSASAGVCQTRYDPWGNSLTRQGADPAGVDDMGSCTPADTANDIWYRTARRDSTTGDYQFGSRTYDPTKASFLTSDSYNAAPSSANLGIGTDPLTRNSYAYVNGDPVNLVDPDGHEPCSRTRQGCSYRRDGGTAHAARYAGLETQRWWLANGAPTFAAMMNAPVHQGTRVAAVIGEHRFSPIPSGRPESLGKYFGSVLQNSDDLVYRLVFKDPADCALRNKMSACGWVAVDLLTAKAGKLWSFADEAIEATRLRRTVSGAKSAGRSLEARTAVAVAEEFSGGAVAKAGGELVPYPDWPPYRGFLGNFTKTETLAQGTVIDRFALTSERLAGGRQFAPLGTPFGARAIPPDYATGVYGAYEVAAREGLTVTAGLTGPWFGAPGLGIQYETAESLAELLFKGILRPTGGS